MCAYLHFMSWMFRSCILMSCIFKPSKLVRHFQVLQFHATLSGPSFSLFRSFVFIPCIFNVEHKMLSLTWSSITATTQPSYLLNTLTALDPRHCQPFSTINIITSHRSLLSIRLWSHLILSLSTSHSAHLPNSRSSSSVGSPLSPSLTLGCVVQR